MPAVSQTLLAVALVSGLSLVGALTLALKESVLRPVITFLVALSVGALFGDAFIHLLPEAFADESVSRAASVAVSAGVFVFFVVERVLRWRHSHGVDEESAESIAAHDHEKKSVGWLVFFGDAIHNLIDGGIIAASFLVSPELGIATTIAVALHELPQEMGDFGLLLHAGWSRAGAIWMNFISSLTAFVGAAAVLALGEVSDRMFAIATAFTAGAFIYIAGSDLVPELGKEDRARKNFIQFSAVGLGFIIMFSLTLLE